MEKDLLEQISSKLGALYNLIETVNLGFKAEKMEEQVIDSLECIAICTQSIKQIIDNKLK